MMFILFLGAALLLAFALVTSRGWAAGPEGPALTVLLGFAVLIGTDWGLALAHLFTARALGLCAAAYVLGGGLLLFRHRNRFLGWRPGPASPLLVLVLAALFCSGLYMLVRGSYLFVMEFDALTYHFPKAVEIIRAHAIPHVPSGDFRVTYFPWNYELLLADGLLLAGGDYLSHLIPLLATCGLGAYAYACFRRAWPEGSGLEALLGVLLVAATPVLLLQAADYKNDVLFTFFLLSLFYWLALWCRTGGRRELVLTFLSLALCAGTKASVLFLGPVILFLVWRWRARFRLAALGGPRQALGLAAGGLVLLVLMGSAWPLFNYSWCGHFLGETAMVGGVPGYQSNAVPVYQGWNNLWAFPLLAVLRPFSSRPNEVWVFWKHQYWWWPAYHPIYSHFGWLCSALLLALPAGVLRHLRRPGAGGAFRLTFTWITLAFVVLSLPQRYRVDGMFCGFPRYLLCLPVLVALWTLLPGLVWLREAGWRKLGGAAGLCLVGYFLAQSWLCFEYDDTKPFSMVMEFMAKPDARPGGQMAFAFDRVAGPADPVAFDSGFGGMSYPLYGAGLTRPVTYLRPAPGTVAIPPEALWVVVDRSWNVGWSHPGVTDTSQFGLPIRRAPSSEDLAVYQQLAKDPRFALVYADPAVNQFVFQRRQHARS